MGQSQTSPADLVLRDYESATVQPELGITLIELLIVITILGILATIAVTGVSDAGAASATAGCEANYKLVETAVEAYKTEEAKYPTAGVTFGVASGSTNGAAALMQRDSSKSPSVGPWLRDAPYSPGNYQIVVSTAGNGSISIYTAPRPAPSTDSGTNGGTLVGSGIASCSQVN